MKYTYNNFLPIHQWKIVDKIICHRFNEQETPFTAYCVDIGERILVSNTESGFVEKACGRIVRWISEFEFDHLRKHEGVVIW